MFFTNWFKPPKPPTEIDRLIADIRSIDVTQYKNVYSSDLSLRRTTTYEPNIIAYIRQLKRVSEYLEKGIIISIHTLPYDLKTVYLRDFFIDDQQRFVDVEATLTEFLELSVRLLTQFQEIERLEDKPFNTEKNLMLLARVVSNLRVLVTETFNVR